MERVTGGKARKILIYVYRIVPLYGRPGALTEGGALSLAVRTETQGGARHSVYFNRGAIASQEYSRRFGGKRPEEAGPAAYAWLSRGLSESIAAFIRRAAGDPDWKPRNLATDASWLDEYFASGSARSLKRRYFSGG